MSDSLNSTFPLKNKKVFIAGHNGMVGSALLSRLSKEDCVCLTIDREMLDLRNSIEVYDWFKKNKPDVVFFAAAKVGGIYANKTYPVNFIYDNLAIQNSVISAAYYYNVSKLMFLGSSCIYPRNANQPLKEEALMSGFLEPSNEFYAIAKIAGLKLCQAYRKQYGSDFISVMPTNLYGPGDNFDAENSHVVAALIVKFYDAVSLGKNKITLWGTGRPLREFMHVDDLADGLVFARKHYSDVQHINLGTGKEISINDFANTLKNITGWEGIIEYDSSYPDGTPRKIMDVSRMTGLGWEAKIGLEQGLKGTYNWYVENFGKVRR